MADSLLTRVPRQPRILVLGGCLVVLLATGCARLSSERRVAPPGSGSNSAQGIAGRTVVEQINSSGQTREYRLHVPAGHSAGQSTALIVNLHGYNSDAEQEEQVSQMSAKGDASGFVVVYPQGLGEPPSWHFGSKEEGREDVAFIRDLIRHLEDQLGVDRNRVYVTGISNGAEMSYRLGCDLSDLVAAMGLISGGYPPFRDCEPTRPVPAVLFHGTADRLLPYDGHPPLLLPVHEWAASWASRNGCAATSRVAFQKGEVTGETWSNCRQGADVVLYTITDKGHSWPGSNMPAAITTHDIVATDVLWEFFAAHPKP